MPTQHVLIGPVSPFPDPWPATTAKHTDWFFAQTLFLFRHSGKLH